MGINWWDQSVSAILWGTRGFHALNNVRIRIQLVQRIRIRLIWNLDPGRKNWLTKKENMRNAPCWKSLNVLCRGLRRHMTVWSKRNLGLYPEWVCVQQQAGSGSGSTDYRSETLALNMPSGIQSDGIYWYVIMVYGVRKPYHKQNKTEMFPRIYADYRKRFFLFFLFYLGSNINNFPNQGFVLGRTYCNCTSICMVVLYDANFCH